MNKHKQKCEILRKIRIAIAEKLGIKGKIKEEPCNFDGDCKGTCPACQKEENMLKEAMTNNKDIKTETGFSNENFGQTMGLVSMPVSKIDASIDGIADRTEYNNNNNSYFKMDDGFVMGDSTVDHDELNFGDILDDYDGELTGIDEPWDDTEESAENTSNNEEE